MNNRELFNDVITYLLARYAPEAIIVYGSFADDNATETSDFDALVITEGVKKHDASLIRDTVLDVWVYPSDFFQREYDPEEFLQIFDGQIVLDQKGNAQLLKDNITAYLSQRPKKTDEEIQQELAWCKKMLLRTRQEDAEGLFRWHWLLIDSLEIYFDLRGLRYFGPKKALRWMEQEDPRAFHYYSAALKEQKRSCLEEWISYLAKLIQYP